MTRQSQSRAETVVWGCYRIHKETERIAKTVDVPVLVVERLIRAGLIDPAWQPEEAESG